MRRSVRRALTVAAGAGAVFTAARIAGGGRWAALTGRLRSELEADRRPIDPRVLNLAAETESLPPPVQSWLRSVLRDGQPMVAAVRVHHRGTFNLSEQEQQWRPFTSDQRVVTHRRGFDWNATIRMLPGLNARVHDAFVGGEGILHASVMGLVPVTDVRGTPEIAEGELFRYLAEATWYPTALLPSQGVVWEEVDKRSARATLRDGSSRVSLVFGFGDDGLVESVRADARGRQVGDTVLPTPWTGRFRDYRERGGMRIPIQAEVAWEVDGEPRPYWRGRIARIDYEFA